MIGGTSGAAGVLLSGAQRGRVIDPVGAFHRPSVGGELPDHIGVVVQHDGHGATRGETSELTAFDEARRATIPATTHDQPAARQTVLVEPGNGDGTKPLRPPGQPDDVVVRRQFDNPVNADGERRVIGCGAEERVPIARSSFQVGDAVADVSDDPINVDHGQRTAVLVIGDPRCRANHGQTVR
jgi:hypothetical protein